MPINSLLQDRNSLLQNLRQGRANATSAKRLAQLINYPVGGNQVLLRTLIKECIETYEDLIGAATGRPAGFFIIDNIFELEIYLDSLENRTKSDNTRRTALINNWNKSQNNQTNKSILRII